MFRFFFSLGRSSSAERKAVLSKQPQSASQHTLRGARNFDRFLQSVQRAQWFDTQFKKLGEQPWTMDPRVDWLPPRLRQVYGVPPAAVAAERLRQMNGQ